MQTQTKPTQSPAGASEAALADKLSQLNQQLGQLQRVMVCFSGGVDSTLLLKLAYDRLGKNAIAFTAQSPSLPSRELDEAKQLSAQIGAEHLIRSTLEIKDEDYAKNPHNRCYFCKSELLKVAHRVAQERGIQHILLGTNLDDLGGHRPGLKAANEHGTRHPLAEAGLRKQEVRQLSAQHGLPTADKPEMACLASRFPYGTRITPERLDQVERFEDGLHALGFNGLRVRFHDQIARIELPAEQFERAIASETRDAMLALGKQIGFRYVTLDLAGYRRGAMNETLAASKQAPDTEQVKRALKRV